MNWLNFQRGPQPSEHRAGQINVRIGMVVTLFLLLAGMAFSQATNSGDITGTVTDSTGAVVPGVTVTVLDVDKNVAHTYKTNEAGSYDTGPIVADHYLLTFVKEGFATYKRGPITLSVGLIGIKVEMTVGGTSQQVVVTSEVPLLETASAEVSSTIPSETLTELPQVGGLTPDWTSFIACLLYTSPSPRDRQKSRMPSSA